MSGRCRTRTYDFPVMSRMFSPTELIFRDVREEHITSSLMVSFSENSIPRFIPAYLNDTPMNAFLISGPLLFCLPGYHSPSWNRTNGCRSQIPVPYLLAIGL